MDINTIENEATENDTLDNDTQQAIAAANEASNPLPTQIAPTPEAMKSTEFHNLTPSEVYALNCKVVGTPDTGIKRAELGGLAIFTGWFNRDDFERVVKLVEVPDAKQASQFKSKPSGKRYNMLTNGANRPMGEASADRLYGSFAEQTFTSPEGYIVPHKWVAAEPMLYGVTCLGDSYPQFDAQSVDTLGQMLSAQHRAKVLTQFFDANPSGIVPIIIMGGIPLEFADSIDTGRSRGTKDMLARHALFVDIDPSTFDPSDHDAPSQGIVDINGLPWGADYPKANKQLCSDLSTIAGILYRRGQGKAAHASDPLKGDSMTQLIKMNPDLEKLAMLTYNHDMGTTRKSSFGGPGKFVSRAFAASCLYMLETASVAPSRNGKDSTYLCNQFEPNELNWDRIEALLIEFKRFDEPNSPFAAMQRVLANTRSIKSASHISKVKMGALVETLKQLAKGIAASDIKVSDAPSLIKRVDYPSFGGMDIGYVPSKRGKKSDDSEE